MITLRRDNVVKQTESEVVALALESRDLSEKGTQRKRLRKTKHLQRKRN